MRLPDVEFYLNVGDWPMEKRNVGEVPGPVPVISWCGSTDTRDIILPTYDISHSTLETMRGVTNDLLSIQGHTGGWCHCHLWGGVRDVSHQQIKTKHQKSKVRKVTAVEHKCHL